MSRLDDLPPDQRAVLLLLVKQGKSQAEIADTLGISREAVRDRAQAALSTLAEEDDPPLPPASEAPRTARAAERAAASPPRRRPAAAGARATGEEPSTSLRVSRRGGALLLGVLVAAVVVVVVLLTSGGGSSNHAKNTAGGASATSAAKKTKGPTVDSQLALTSPEPSSKAVGLAEVVSEGSKRGIYIAAEHLPPSTGFSYVVWLSNSQTSSEALGKAPAVSSNGRLQGGALLPSDAGKYHKLLLTRETSSHPTEPGPLVLSGTFSLTRK